MGKSGGLPQDATRPVVSAARTGWGSGVQLGRLPQHSSPLTGQAKLDSGLMRMRLVSGDLVAQERPGHRKPRPTLRSGSVRRPSPQGAPAQPPPPAQLMEQPCLHFSPSLEAAD